MELLSYLAPTENPRASVLLAHGYAEHHGRYREFIAALNDADYDVWTFDFEGHGDQPGKRGNVDVARLIGAHLEARRQLTFDARTEKTFLFGHSMGGLVTLASAILNPHHLAAVAVTGPALKPLPSVPVSVAKFLSSVAKALPPVGTVKIDETRLTHDANKATEYKSDPLVYTGKVPLLTAATMTVQGYYTLKNAAILARPTLILHAGDDQLAALTASEEFAQQSDKTQIRVIDDTYHELLNEVDRSRYATEIINWYGQW